MDILGLQNAIEKIDQQTLPQIVAAIEKLEQTLAALVQRLDGTTITVKLGPQKG